MITCGHDIHNSSPEKVEAVLDAPHPQRVTEVRSFVGFVNYFNRFMANQSTVVQPLNQLLEKNPQTKYQNFGSKFRSYKRNFAQT